MPREYQAFLVYTIAGSPTTSQIAPPHLLYGEDDEIIIEDAIRWGRAALAKIEGAIGVKLIVEQDGREFATVTPKALCERETPADED